jgi:hypothetical protein
MSKQEEPTIPVGFKVTKQKGKNYSTSFCRDHHLFYYFESNPRSFQTTASLSFDIL